MRIDEQGFQDSAVEDPIGERDPVRSIDRVHNDKELIE
jgi:hypothetical protein